MFYMFATSFKALLKKQSKHKGGQASLTRVVVRRPSEDDGPLAGLDEPLGPGAVLSGPAAERQEVEVAGEPHVGCSGERNRETPPCLI